MTNKLQCSEVILGFLKNSFVKQVLSSKFIVLHVLFCNLKSFVQVISVVFCSHLILFILHCHIKVCFLENLIDSGRVGKAILRQQPILFCHSVKIILRFQKGLKDSEVCLDIWFDWLSSFIEGQCLFEHHGRSAELGHPDSNINPIDFIHIYASDAFLRWNCFFDKTLKSCWWGGKYECRKN